MAFDAIAFWFASQLADALTDTLYEADPERLDPHLDEARATLNAFFTWRGWKELETPNADV